MADKETPLPNHFMELSKLLDQKNDKHERIYKSNRDVTQKSKKIIFSLQRIPGLPEKEAEKILDSATQEFRDLEQTLLKYIAMELEGEDSFRYLNAYTGGLQEYIEAVLFNHYIRHNEIMTLDAVRSRLIFSGVDGEISLTLFVPQKEYFLGLADLTGELMRYCIKSTSIGEIDVCTRICELFRLLSEGFTSLGHINRPMDHKIFVFRQSLRKVEDARYSLQLRKSELPDNMLADLFIDTNRDSIIDRES